MRLTSWPCLVLVKEKDSKNMCHILEHKHQMSMYKHWIIIEKWCIFFGWISINANLHSYTNLINLTYVILKYTSEVMFHPMSTL